MKKQFLLLLVSISSMLLGQSVIAQSNISLFKTNYLANSPYYVPGSTPSMRACTGRINSDGSFKRTPNTALQADITDTIYKLAFTFIAQDSVAYYHQDSIKQILYKSLNYWLANPPVWSWVGTTFTQTTAVGKILAYLFSDSVVIADATGGTYGSVLASIKTNARAFLLFSWNIDHPASINTVNTTSFANFGDSIYDDHHRLGNLGYRIAGMTGIACAIGDSLMMDTINTIVSNQFALVSDTIGIADNGVQGFAYDGTLFQHGAQFQNAGYGKDFFNDVLSGNSYNLWTTNTKWALNTASQAEKANIAVNGLVWLSWYNTLPHNLNGRGDCQSGHETFTNYSYINNCYNSAAIQALPIYPLVSELNTKTVSAQTGGNLDSTKYFWNSHVIVSQSINYMGAIRMLSSRILGDETSDATSGQGLMNFHMADGSALIYHGNGTDYDSSRVCWNWRCVPGITAKQRTGSLPLVVWGAGYESNNTLAGGVSDGSVSMGAFHLDRTNSSATTKAYKSYFTFKDAMICVGNSIADSYTGTGDVYTTLNQSSFRSIVYYSLNGGAVQNIPLGTFTSVSSNIKSPSWYWHDSIGYIILPMTASDSSYVLLTTQQRTGNWYNLDIRNANASVNANVFQLSIDHGGSGNTNWLSNRYSYVVLPGVSKDSLISFYSTHILTKDSLSLYINYNSSNIISASYKGYTGVFFLASGNNKATSLGYDSLNVSANGYGSVLMQRSNNWMNIHVADINSNFSSKVKLKLGINRTFLNNSFTPPNADSSSTITASGDSTIVSVYTSKIAPIYYGEPVHITALKPATFPGIPTNVSGIGGNHQVTVSFTAPTNNGGATITGYTVTPYIGGVAQTAISGSSSPIMVTGLTNGTAYTFTVYATNSVGNGTASTISSSVTPATVPDAPSIVSVISGNQQVTVAFSTPFNEGSTITGYTITPYIGGVAQTTVSGSSSPIVVTSLTNGAAYTFTVFATNSLGNGTASTASSAITPATVPGVPIIVSASGGNQQAYLSFTAPSSNGGAAITSFTVTSSPSGFTGTGTSSPIVVTGLSNGTNYTFTIYATNSIGNGSTSAASGSVKPSSDSYTWIGTSSTNWNDVNNWAPTGLPDATSLVTITKVGSYDLAIEVSPTVASLAISSGNNVTLNNGQTLTLNGNLANAGTFTANVSSSVVIATSASIAGTGVTNFNNLTINSGKTLTGGNIGISGTFTNSGTYTASTGAINFNGTGAQTIPALTYNNLSITNTTATVTAGGTIGVSGVLTIANTATFNMSTFQLTGATLTTSGNGTLKTQCTTNPAIPTSTTWNFNVMFNGTANQTTPGIATFNSNLTISPSSGKIVSAPGPGPITINGGILTIVDGATFSMAAGAADSLGGTFTTSNGGGSGIGKLVTLSGLGGKTPYRSGLTFNFEVDFGNLVSYQIVPVGNYVSLNTNYGTAAKNYSAGIYNISSVYTPGTHDSYNAATVIVFNGTTAQSIPPAVNTSASYPNISITNIAGVTATGTLTLASGGILTIASSATLDMSIYQLLGAFTPTGTGTLKTASTSSPAIPGANYSYSVNFYAAGAQTIAASTSFSNALTIIAGTTTAPSSLMVGGNFTINSGANFTAPSGNLNVSGHWYNNGGTYNANGGTVILNGVNQSLNGSSTFNNLTKTVTTTDVLTFQAGSTQAITGALTLSGASNNLLEIYSSSLTTQANINPSGTRSINYVAVRGSDNINATVISTSNSLDSGSNTNWQLITVPDAPSITSATSGNQQVTVAFSTPFNEGSTIAGYTVTPYIGGVAQTTVFGSSSPIVVTGLTNGTAYTFTVFATNGMGNGAASATSSVVIPATVPSIPSIVSATSGNQQVTVSFTVPSSNGGAAITGYTVTPYISGVAQTTTTGSSSPIVVAGLTNGTNYTFTVLATNSVGNGTASTASSSVTPASVPDAPNIVSATGANQQVTLAFTTPFDEGSAITGFTVTPYIGGVAQTTVVGSSSPIVVTGLTNGTTYTFTVSAINSIGNGSASIASSSITPATVPGIPSIVSATGGNQQVSLAFNAPSSNGGATISGYTVTTYIGGVAQATTFGSSSPILVTGLTNGTTYAFTINATNSVGNGAASTASSSVTPATVPDAPIIDSAIGSNQQVTIGFTVPFNEGSAITGYTVTPYIGGVAQATVVGSSSPILVTGLTNGIAYTFTVYATNSVGNGAASAASIAVTPSNTYTWVGASSTNWNDFNNWNPTGLPASGAVVTITKGGSYNLSIEVSPTVGSISISTGNNVTLTNGQSLTLNGNFTNTGVFNGNNTSSVVIAANDTISGTGTTNFNNLTINMSATLTGGNIGIAGVFINNGGFTASTGTINFNGTIAQTIPAGTYNNLTVTNATATVSAGGAIACGGVLNITSAANLDMGTYQLTGTFTTSGVGTLKTACTANSAIPSNTYSFGVNYTAATGGQYFVGTYINGITFSNTSGTDTASGNTFVAGLLAIPNSGSIVNMGTHLLGGALQSANATITSASIAVTLSAANASILPGMTVKGDNIPIGTTVAAVSGTSLTLSKAATGSSSTYPLTFNLTTSGSGTLETYNITSGSVALAPADYAFTLKFAGAGNQTMPNGQYSIANLVIVNAGYTVGTFGNFSVNGLFTIASSATFTAGSTITGSFTTSGTGTMNVTNTSSTPLPAGMTYTFTVNYSSTSAQTIVAGNYTTLNASAASSGNRTLAAGTVAVSTSFTPGTSGTYTVAVGDTLSLGYSNTLPATLGTNATNYANLTITGGTTTAPATLKATGAFCISGGTFTAPSSSFTVGGNWNNTGGTYSANGGTVIFNGGNQAITGSTTFSKVKKSVTSAATLTFPSGQTQTFNDSLILTGVLGNLLTINASTSGSQAYIHPSASKWTVQYATVSDNNNTCGTNIFAHYSSINNCSGWSASSTSNVNLSNDLVAEVTSSVVLYPNPLKGNNLNVRMGGLAAGKYTLSIYNAIGQRVSEQAISCLGDNGSYSIRLNSPLAGGTYSVVIRKEGSKRLMSESNLWVQH